MSYHVMASSRGIGLGKLGRVGFGEVTSIYDTESLLPGGVDLSALTAAYDEEMGAGSGGGNGSGSGEEDNKLPLILGAGAVVLVAGVATVMIMKRKK